MYTLDLTTIKTWSTYKHCIDLKFIIENGKLMCKVLVWDGDNYDGLRQSKRFSAKLILPDSFIHILEGDILEYLDYLAENSYEDYLKEQKRIWKENFKNNILNK